MNRQTLKLAVLTILFGLAVGMLLPQLRRGEWKEWFAEKEPAITLPEGELVSDAFSIKLLQTALQTPEYPVTYVCPAAMTEALHEIETLSKGAAIEQIQALGLSSQNSSTAETYLLSAMDADLPGFNGKGTLLPLPFRSNYPEAVSTFNSFFGFSAADSANTSPDTRFFMATRTVLNAVFRVPFYAADGKTGDFENADGGMPAVRLMRRCGQFRTAEAADGSWKAVALMLDNSRADAALVAVLPQGNVRDFALSLNPSILSDIRRALAESTPQELTVEMPKLHLSVGVRDSASLLQAVGVTAPFDIRLADFSVITSEKVALNALAESLSIVLPEEADRPADIPSPDSGAPLFSLTRPFLWFAGDLTTPAPPAVLGIVENL